MSSQEWGPKCCTGYTACRIELVTVCHKRISHMFYDRGHFLFTSVCHSNATVSCLDAGVVCLNRPCSSNKPSAVSQCNVSLDNSYTSNLSLHRPTSETAMACLQKLAACSGLSSRLLLSLRRLAGSFTIGSVTVPD